jgi:exportin-1
MLDRLAKQVDGSEFTWQKLNTLSWSIGSISGTMSELDEKRFLVTVIKDLLGLCEQVKGKDNKAVVASSIMYVVGQYPRFLRAHWKFLRTVVFKLFEFMHEKHPGVQDMAVDTFLKITQKCRKKFVQLQKDEPHTFCAELCGNLPGIIADLEPHQVMTFYEAAGCMVSAEPDAATRYDLCERLLAPQNALWARIMASAKENPGSTFGAQDALRELLRILRVNTAACKSIGAGFDRQLGALYLDMLGMFEELSRMIRAELARGHQFAAQGVEVKAMRAVKKEALTLVQTFIGLAEDPRFVALNFVPPLLAPVLADYAASPPATRDAEVLALLAEAVNKLRGDILGDVPRILAAVFEPTLQMIASDFVQWPEHRLAFFRLLEAVVVHCFPAIFQIPPAHTKLVVDSVVWAFKHTARDIGETGLNILETLLRNVAASGPELAQAFFGQFLLPLVRDLLEVLTDRLHKGHFKQHAALLRHIFHLVESGHIVAPLWESPFAAQTGAAAAFQARLQATAAAHGGVLPPGLLTNQQFVREFVRGLVAANFANLSAAQVQHFIDGLFNTGHELKAYKTLLRDFLVQVLEFGEEEGGASGEAAALTQGLAAIAVGAGFDAGGGAGAGAGASAGGGAGEMGGLAPGGGGARGGGGGGGLFAEERAEQLATAAAAELERRRQVPGLLQGQLDDDDDDDDA